MKATMKYGGAKPAASTVADSDTRANAPRRAQTPPKHQNCHTACHSSPATTQLASYLTTRQLPHNSPATTQLAGDIQLAGGIQLACQRYRACALSHSLPTTTQLANGVKIANCHSLPAATKLTDVYSLPTTTQLTNCHKAYQRYIAC